MIYNTIKERESKILEKNKMEISLDPRIATAINNSQFVSSNANNFNILFSIKRKISYDFKTHSKSWPK